MSDNTDKEPSMVDAEPARKRLEKLYSMGYTKNEIKRFGVSTDTQLKITRDKAETISRYISERIFAIKGRRLSEGQCVSAKPAYDMVRGWTDAGLSQRKIADVAGISHMAVSHIRNRKNSTIFASTLMALLKHRKELDEMAREKSARKKSSEE